MGKIETDHTGSGGGITLSSDGTSLLLDGTAIGGGGGGADLYAANESSPAAQPSATGANAVAIGDSAIASELNSLAGPFSRSAGSPSVALGIANNSSSYGAGGSYSISVGYQSRAMALQSVALGSGAYVDSDSSRALALGQGAYVQQCDYGTAIGRNARVHGGNTATGATAIGSSYASGTDSFAAVITDITSSYGATGASSIAIGQLSKATAANSIAIGDTAISTTANQIALGGTTDTVKISGTYTLPATDGTANQVLTTDGAGAVTFATAGGGGGGALEFVSKTTISSSVSQVDFTNLDDDAYYRLIGKYIVFSGSTFPRIEFMNASNVVQSNCYSYRRDGSSTLTVASGGADINCYTPDTDRHGVEIELSTKANGNFMFYRGHGPKSNGTCIISASFDANNTSTRIGGLRFRPNGGTISSGQFLLYKYKES